jgi:DNA transformation protein and related proteins
MAAAPDPFVAHCLDLLAPLGAPRARRMFGGHGLYVDDLFVAIVVRERLYLKVDVAAAPNFDAAGCEPFAYRAGERQVVLGFRAAPAEAMDSPALMQPWARLALQAALAARAATPARGARKVTPARRATRPRR